MKKMNKVKVNYFRGKVNSLLIKLHPFGRFVKMTMSDFVINLFEH